MKEICFITGSRSEVGALITIVDSLIARGEYLDYKILIHGAHNLALFGNTQNELSKRFPSKSIIVKTIFESTKGNCDIFTRTVSVIYEVLLAEKISHVFIIGDRIESYASAISAHLCGAKIYHYGGGNISRGSNDNIYRFNITNLSHVHFTTSKPAYDRLLSLPTIDRRNIHCAGSSSVDSIISFLTAPERIGTYYPQLEDNKYALITFHPDIYDTYNVAELLNLVIQNVINNGLKALVTYPNHDFGYEKIIQVIESWRSNASVVIVKHLGKQKYFSAIYSSRYVIGNTSSGFVEVPYFGKVFYNVGCRQEGRDADPYVKNLDSSAALISHELKQLEHVSEMENCTCSMIYGNGNASDRIIDILNEN